MIAAIGRQARYFLAMLRLNMQVTLAYRGNFVIMQLTALIIPVTSLLVWQAVLASGASLPVSSRYLTAYFLLVALVEMLTSSWIGSFLAQSIRDGGLNHWLVRPTSTHMNSITNNLGEKLIKLLIMAPVIAAMIVLVAAVGGESTALPCDPVRWLGFAAAVIIGGTIRFTLDVLIGSLAFWIEDVSGILRVTAVVVPVLAGAVVPLSLVPTDWRAVADLQPFQYILSFPLTVLLNNSTPYAGFAGQLGWLVVFGGAAVVCWRAGLRSYAGTGA